MQVQILPGCTACGACEADCPEVFHVTDVAHVDSRKIPGHEDCCVEAADDCPVNVIKIIQ